MTYIFLSLQTQARDYFLIDVSYSGMGVLSDTIKIFLSYFQAGIKVFLPVEVSECIIKFEGPLGLSL